MIITLIISSYVIEALYLNWQQSKLNSMEQARLRRVEFSSRTIKNAILKLESIESLSLVPGNYTEIHNLGMTSILLNLDDSLDCTDSIIYRFDMPGFVDSASVAAYHNKMYIYLYVCKYRDNSHINQKVIKQKIKAFPISNVLIE